MGFVVDKVTLGLVFSEYSNFFLHSLPSIIRSWYNMPNSGRRTMWTQASPHSKEFKKKELSQLRSKQEMILEGDVAVTWKLQRIEQSEGKEDKL
jgi:hypothetical protein